MLSPRPVEQVRQPDARALQPIPNEGDVLFEIRDIHDDYLLVLALRERLVPLLIEALRVPRAGGDSSPNRRWRSISRCPYTRPRETLGVDFPDLRSPPLC